MRKKPIGGFIRWIKQVILHKSKRESKREEIPEIDLSSGAEMMPKAKKYKKPIG